MEYELERCTRKCATSGRELLPGETFFSALFEEGAGLVRRDYSAEAWTGPAEGVVGWWKSHMPDPTAKKNQLAPNDIILSVFDQLESQPDKRDTRYLLALLLVRRRVMRLEDHERDESGGEVAVLYCPRREATYRVPVAMPDSARAAQIQAELSQLLFAGAT